MLSKLFVAIVVLAVLAGILLAGLSLYSRNAFPLRSVEGRLAPCPDSPNCVSSEDPGRTSYVEPIHFQGDALAAWARITAAVQATGGQLVQQDPGYLRATYTTPILRFVDDLELRLEKRFNYIQVRSASRVGYSDRGVNRRRVERLREAFDSRP